MAQLVDPRIEAYAEQNTSPPPPYLVALAAETRETMEMPEMMVGPVEGRFLEMLAYTSRATRVLEIGTFTGYSALSMVTALPPEGRITTCESNPNHAEVARRHIAAAGFAEMIEVREGPALESIAELAGPFDLVFIDADKTGYSDYYEAVLPKLSGRGIIAADNTFRGGSVIDPADNDENAAAIKAFNQRVANDHRVTCVQLTIRDGITLIRLR